MSLIDFHYDLCNLLSSEKICLRQHYMIVYVFKEFLNLSFHLTCSLWVFLYT